MNACAHSCTVSATRIAMMNGGLSTSREYHHFPFTASPLFCTLFQLMSRMCSITGKKGSTGNKRSHSNRATRRTFRANIQKKRVFDAKTGEYVTIKVSTAYLRTMAKRLSAGK